ncbi:hypothetical protein DM02DRAFT_365691 [Periconia macrospinosa]|uniref:Uncharacterized protein n=1 Tax=Periconia macrospinosa TaxID=97972 RepID=A0A2V1DSR5_9PLEO|nr:hypothetical protein DM02DRAFT_365691 [Periconia macrospinosa]
MGPIFKINIFKLFAASSDDTKIGFNVRHLKIRWRLPLRFLFGPICTGFVAPVPVGESKNHAQSGNSYGHSDDDYSRMAQGFAMSFLVRCIHVTNSLVEGCCVVRCHSVLALNRECEMFVLSVNVRRCSGGLRLYIKSCVLRDFLTLSLKDMIRVI